jgi:translocation and assembly module TamB
MSWRRRIIEAALAAGVLSIIAASTGYLYLRSNSFNRFALRKIGEEASQTTGGQTTIDRMDFSLSGLTANLYDITMRGSEGPGTPPLLHVDKLTVGLTIMSVLHRRVSLSELLVLHPVVHVQVDRDGKTNLPAAPPSHGSGHSSVFDLGVRHAQITNGEVDYNDRRMPLDADLHDLETDVHFTPVPQQYEGVLSYKNGFVRYATIAPVSHDFDLKFNATPERFTVESANLRSGSSTLQLRGELSDYGSPRAEGSYQVLLHAQDFREMLRPAQVEGDISLSGRLNYQTVESQPVLRNLLIDGHLASQELALAATGKHADVRSLKADYHLGGGNLAVNNLSAESFGGRILGHAEMNHLDAIPDTHVQASLQDISLRALQQAVEAQQFHGTPISGQIAGQAEATWRGGVESLHAHSDLTLRAHASRSNPSAQEIPVNGAVHVSYDGPREIIELHDTSLTTSTANLTAHGVVSDRSNLQLQLVAQDLHQLELLASTFGLNRSLPAISGKATLNALVQGSIKEPLVSAQLNAQDLHVEGSEWTRATLALQASPSELKIQDGKLISAQRGQASFSADIQLHNWAYRPSDRLQAQLYAQQFSITDLQQLANRHYPISGLASAKLSMHGSLSSPAGTGQVEITDATVYGEPIQKLTASVHTDNATILSQFQLTAKAGTVDGDFSYTPTSKAYKVRVDVPGIVLQRLQALQAKNSPLTGTVTASVRGEGTVDDPQLIANVQLPELQAKGKSISELRVEAQVAKHSLNFDLDSKVAQVPVHAHGQMALTGDYDVQANLDTAAIPLDAVMAAYASNVPTGFQGQTEVHAKLRGPLKDKARMEAHLSIPVLQASYQSLQVGIKNPIRADYANSVLTLQPADIEGTGTSLHVQGRLPFGGPTAPTITANGSVDLRILRMIAPEIQTSGLLALDVRTSGTSQAPAFQGQLQLKDAALSTQDTPIGIEKLNGILDISESRMQVSTMTGIMGGGQFSVGGAITYRPNLQFNLAIQSQSVRLLYPDGLRTLLDTNLAFSGTPTASTLSGRVLIDRLSFTPDFDLASFGDQFSGGGKLSQPGFADTIKLVIAVQSRENLNATSSQVSIAGQAALRVGGTAANPVITGRATLNSGELFYRNVRYQLQRGVITFDDPNETHPVLNVSATTTVEQYNLTLTLRGPLDRLTTSYVSDPPLATADIINLVARGKTTQESAASSQSTDSMIASQVASQLSSSVQKLAGISSLQIDPTIGNGQNPSARVAIQQRVTKNLLFTFSTDLSEPGSEIVQGEYQINKRWSVSVQRDQLGGVSVDGRYHSKF